MIFSRHGRLHDGLTRVEIGGQSLQAPQEWRRRVMCWLASARKHQASASAPTNGAIALRAETVVVEPLGSHLLVTATSRAAAEVVTRTDFPVRPGCQSVGTEPDKLRWLRADGRDGVWRLTHCAARPCVLKKNDLGDWTKRSRCIRTSGSWTAPSSRSVWRTWIRRALRELETLFAASGRRSRAAHRFQSRALTIHLADGGQRPHQPACARRPPPVA